MKLRGIAAAFGLSLLAVSAISPAGAIEAQPGSANFTAPGSVPNYFSNESGVLQGGAAARAGQPPGVTPRYAAPAAPSRQEYYASRGRYHAAHGGGRSRSSYASAHGRHGGGRYVQSSHGGSRGSVHVTSSTSRSRTAAAKSHPAAAGRRAQARGRG